MTHPQPHLRAKFRLNRFNLTGFRPEKPKFGRLVEIRHPKFLSPKAWISPDLVSLYSWDFPQSLLSLSVLTLIEEIAVLIVEIDNYPKLEK